MRHPIMSGSDDGFMFNERANERTSMPKNGRWSGRGLGVSHEDERLTNESDERFEE